MISQERAIEGLTEYFEKEIIAKIGGLRKWGLDAVKQDLVETYVCKHLDTLDYIRCRDENGMINAEKLISQLIVSAKKFGPAVEHFPIVGDITFTEKDLIALGRYLGLSEY